MTTAGDADTFVRMIDVARGTGSDIESLTDEGIGYYTYSQPAWSPRGTQIAFGVDTGIALYDVTTGEARNIERLNGGSIAQALFFASTRAALELVEGYSSLKLRKREVREGSVLAVNDGRIVGRDSFRPDMSFEEQPLPAVRTPTEARATLARLAALHAI